MIIGMVLFLVNSSYIYDRWKPNTKTKFEELRYGGDVGKGLPAILMQGKPHRLNHQLRL